VARAADYPGVAVPPGSLLWLALLGGSSGYADEARGFLRALEAAGMEPAARDMKLSADKLELSSHDELMLQRQYARKTSKPYVAVWHYQPGYPQNTLAGAVNVARTMFETDLMPPHWVEPLLERDMVWVPGEHNLEAFRRTGIPESKLRVLGGTMDFELFQPEAEPYPLDVPEDHFTFLTTFAFQERKGWRQLLQAWGKSFGRDDGVCLVLKTGAIERGDDWIRARIDSFLREEFGPGMVTALARIGGRPLGVVANNPVHLAGAITSDGADKAARFMQLCDAFDLPVVSLIDTPGMMVGPEAEATALVRHCSRLFVTGAALRVPFVAVILRKAYGLGAQAMAAGSLHEPLLTVGWPTAELGAMGLEGAVRLGFRRELDAIADEEARERRVQELTAGAHEHAKALNAATLFELDDVIDPAETRRLIASTLAAAAEAGEPAPASRRFVDSW
jgi:hypothetical protein